jgi:hypothetical protein
MSLVNLTHMFRFSMHEVRILKALKSINDPNNPIFHHDFCHFEQLHILLNRIMILDLKMIILLLKMGDLHLMLMFYKLI